MENTLLAELQQLQQQLLEAEARLTVLNNERTRLGLTYDLWTPEIQAADRAVNDQNAVIARLRRLVEDKTNAVAALDLAIAQNVASGMDSETARTKALADVERAKGMRTLLTYTGIGLFLVLLVLAIIYFSKRKKLPTP